LKHRPSPYQKKYERNTLNRTVTIEAFKRFSACRNKETHCTCGGTLRGVRVNIVGINITYSVCVSVVFLSSKQSASALLYCHLSPVGLLTYISTLCHKQHDFRKKNYFDNVLCYSPQLLSDIFPVLKINRYIFINVYLYRIALIFSNIKETCIFLTEFRKPPKY
jgi:hypothetical protein